MKTYAILNSIFCGLVFAAFAGFLLEKILTVEKGMAKKMIVTIPFFSISINIFEKLFWQYFWHIYPITYKDANKVAFLVVFLIAIYVAMKVGDIKIIEQE